MPVATWLKQREFMRLAKGLFVANGRLTVGVIAAGVLSGALLPGFMLASGALLNALTTHASPYPAVIALVAVFLAERLVDPGLEILGQSLWRHIDESLSQRLMRALVTPPGISQVEDPKVQSVLTRAQGTVTDTTPGQGGYFLGRNVATVVQGLGSLVILGFFRWWLPVVLFVFYRLSFRAYRLHWHEITTVVFGRVDALRQAYYLRSVAMEPAAAKEVRVFGLAQWLVDGYRQKWLTEMAAVWRARRESWVLAVVVTLGLGVVELGAIGLIAYEAGHGHTSVGEAVVLVQALLASSILGRYQDGQWYLSTCARAMEDVENVEREAATARSVDDSGQDATGLPHHSIRFEGVRFAYPGHESNVYEHLDLNIEAGRSLAIVGENGVGKTTLVKLLCRLYDPDAGRITIDGTDLREFSPLSWHRRVAAVFQDYVQFELTAYDNVAFGALHCRDDVDGVADAVREAGAQQVIDRLERGLNTPLTRQLAGGTQLSGGEWQRLALARALFAVRSGAGLLILDEPTAALDVGGEAEIYDRFLELTRGVTTMVISHRFSTVRRADRIVVIESGRVIEDGTHDDLVQAGGRYAVMYQAQASRFAADGTSDA